jgi:hypothetical protein
LSGDTGAVEDAIRQQFTDQKVQDDAVGSILRRLGYIEEEYHGRVVSVSGDFILDPARGNSLFPEGFDHAQTAKVEVRKDDGKK